MQDLKSLFLLRPDITFLNFGSFGATPRPVFEKYQWWQTQLEYEPVQHIAVRGPVLLREARQALGNFVGADADDLVFTRNPTQAFNIVAKNMNLQPGDEILSTDLEYGAMDRTWNYYARKGGWVYRRQPIPLPLASEEEFIEAFWKGYNPRTKAIFISEITSSTALKFPVKQICARAKELGLITIVDGAHSPAQIPVNLRELDPDFYTGACHKWMMAPKGCSFLYAKRSMQPSLDPLIISWGYEAAMPSHSQFIDYHEFNGTADFSAYLTLPECIAFMEKYNWNEVSRSCRELTHSNIERFANLLGTQPLAPLNSDMFVQMCSLEIKTDNPMQLKKKLYEEYNIEIPVMPHNGKVYIRYSIQAFNSQADLDHLYSTLESLISKGEIRR